MEKISKYIDHTLLSASCGLKDIKKLCDEAREHDFHSVCVNLFYVPECYKALKGSDVKVCTVVGFPLGQCSGLIKAKEAEQAVRQGAGEVDMVLNVAALKDGRADVALAEIKDVRSAVGKDAYLKVIIECCLLTDEEKRKACALVVEGGADCVKTSTGFSVSGAKVEDVALMRKEVGDKFGVKASGGIRDFKAFMSMIEAGASRIGCSASVAILNEAKAAGRS